MVLAVEPLARAHGPLLVAFANPHTSLVQYLRRFALRHAERDLWRTFVAIDIVGTPHMSHRGRTQPGQDSHTQLQASGRFSSKAPQAANPLMGSDPTQALTTSVPPGVTLK
jgi:hypothetical protein